MSADADAEPRRRVPTWPTCGHPMQPWGCRRCRDRQRETQRHLGVVLRAYEPRPPTREERKGGIVVNAGTGYGWADDFEEEADLA